MKVPIQHKRIVQISSLFLGACLAVLLAACSADQQQTTVNTVTTAVPQVAALQFSTALTHSPVGTVELNWDGHSHDLQVKVSATGLAPNSTHPEHIHAGTCASNPMGPIVYTLKPLVADEHGIAVSETTIEHVEHGIPSQGWYVNVHNGPTLNTSLEAAPIACSNVRNVHKDSDNQEAQLSLEGTMAPNESVHGNAVVHVQDNKLVVTLALSGLVPNSTHMAHIHAGTCASQGAVVYPLSPVVADAQGNANTTTTLTIKNPQQITSAQLYINVHEAGTMSAMASQQGFNPIACGNIG